MSLVVHGDRIYFAAYGTEDRRGIYAVSINGGEPTQLAWADINSPDSCKLVATDGAYVYYVNRSTLERVSVNGGPSEELAPATTADSDSRCVAVDETFVYWLGKSSGQGGAPAGLLRVPKQGGEVSAVEHPAAESLALHGDTAFVATPNAITSVPKSGGTPITLAGQLVYGSHRMDSDGVFVYWADGAEDAVMRVPIEGGAPETLAADQMGYGLLVDGHNLYWSHRPNAALENRLMVLALPNGVAVPLAKTVGAVDIAVDATSIYWASYSENAIRKTAR